jgi:kynurenine formamidase
VSQYKKRATYEMFSVQRKLLTLEVRTMTSPHDHPSPHVWHRIPERVLGLVLIVGLTALALGQSPVQNTPIGPKWWPSEYGADDQRGAANRMTAQKVLEANRLIKTGKVYQLGQVYEQGMPLAGNRSFKLTIPGSPTAGPSGKNEMVSHDEMFTGEIGQVGTQLDGLGHVGVRVGNEDYFYNGFKRSEFSKAYGLQKLGVENVGVFFTRGLLLDVAKLRNTDRLPEGYVVTVNDLQSCLDAAKLQIHTGDIVLIHTGHGKLWLKDNAAYGHGEPGIGMDAARWLTGKKITLVGADTWAIEVVPHEDKQLSYPVHQWNLTRNGVYQLENLKLDELAADKVYEFAFIFAPLRFKGATGSPGNPIAVR